MLKLMLAFPLYLAVDLKVLRIVFMLGYNLAPISSLMLTRVRLVTSLSGDL